MSIKRKSYILSAPAVFLSALLMIFALPSVIHAKTTIDQSGLPAGISLSNVASWAQDFQDACDKNGPAYSNAFFFSNTLGYTIGKATIGSLPHFEIGTSASAGLTNMTNFQHSSNGIYDGTVPGFGLAPSFHFGVGIGGGFDFIGKFMSYNQDLYKVPIPENRYFNLDQFSEYAIGGRLRYNAVAEKTVIPFLLTFGGVTFSAGGDFMRGIVAANGQYTKDMGSQTVDVSGIPVTVAPSADGKYKMSTSWYEISSTVQAVAYFDIMYLFSVYTGLGVTLGYGWFQFDFDATLDVKDTSGNYALATGSDDVGTVGFKSTNTYNPDVFIPAYIVGLELNIALLKIDLETQVNLLNRSDVSASIGLRMQF